MMDIGIINKIILFWVVFFITPGPVWVSIMEATRNLPNAKVWNFFLSVFLPVNLIVQFSQAVICVLLVELVLQVFANVGFWFYILGGAYILYLAYKVINSKNSNINLKLNFSNLAIVMALSPKIWLLFPSGAIIATQLELGIMMTSVIFALLMLVISSLMFTFYVALGKMGTKLLKGNFSYLSFLLLILFALFLFYEAIKLAY
ncbi:MAG: hypothetical protein PSN35_06165 [Candidatus Thioglobus sp.]|uniref:hypothetical protein n=1 Tax=Candidatus Thioglobus sp. TaxID=2026721 RepID=UPI002618582A|nr:hypothetical protein [Candidatus Thioglobus sp.]MDC9727400.1 hypothetical protein [Candidatus Thioglobus sp.]